MYFQSLKITFNLRLSVFLPLRYIHFGPSLILLELFLYHLTFVHTLVQASILDQLVMRTSLNDLSFVHDINRIGIYYGLEPVGDNHYRTFPL